MLYARFMAKILSGKTARAVYAAKLKEKISKLKAKPRLAILQIGDRQESFAYIKAKIKFGAVIGAEVLHFQFDEATLEQTVIDKILELNTDTAVHGIIVQLPLPPTFHTQKILDTIDQSKDVDGLTTENRAGRATRKEGAGFTPATARGVMELLSYYEIPIKGQKITIFGRSALSGGPVADTLSSAGAQVTVCNSQTSRVEQIAASVASDIIITAIGKPKYFGPDFFNRSDKQVVIDVGMTSIIGTEAENLPWIIGRKKFQGDVDFEAVEPLVGAIPPVPGAVGLRTVLENFKNLVDAAERKN